MIDFNRLLDEPFFYFNELSEKNNRPLFLKVQKDYECFSLACFIASQYDHNSLVKGISDDVGVEMDKELVYEKIYENLGEIESIVLFWIASSVKIKISKEDFFSLSLFNKIRETNGIVPFLYMKNRNIEALVKIYISSKKTIHPFSRIGYYE